MANDEMTMRELDRLAARIRAYNRGDSTIPPARIDLAHFLDLVDAALAAEARGVRAAASVCREYGAQHEESGRDVEAQACRQCESGVLWILTPEELTTPPATGATEGAGDAEDPGEPDYPEGRDPHTMAYAVHAATITSKAQSRSCNKHDD